MSEATVRAQINTVVAAVTNIGGVHDYERWSDDWSAFLTQHKVTISSVDQIRTWLIGYRGFPESVTDGQFNIVPGARRHRFMIFGFLGLDDSAGTEKTFSALAEAVCDALDGDNGAGGLHNPASFLYAHPAMLVTVDMRVYGDVLCHYAEIQMEVEEVVQN